MRILHESLLRRYKSRRVRWLEYVIDMGGGHTKCWLETFKERNLMKQL